MEGAGGRRRRRRKGRAVELQPGSPLLTGVMRLPASHVTPTKRGAERQRRGRRW